MSDSRVKSLDSYKSQIDTPALYDTHYSPDKSTVCVHCSCSYSSQQIFTCYQVTAFDILVVAFHTANAWSHWLVTSLRAHRRAQQESPNIIFEMFTPVTSVEVKEAGKSLLTRVNAES